MKIRYLKTTESFEIEVPDPLQNRNGNRNGNGEEDSIVVRISDYDLVMLLNSGFAVRGEEVDDDTFYGIKLLKEKWNLSVRILTLAKRQQHLRKLNRVDTAWVELKRKERKPREGVDSERIKYLKENYEMIALNCVKREWFDKFTRLCKEVFKGITKEEIREKYSNMRKRVI